MLILYGIIATIIVSIIDVKCFSKSKGAKAVAYDLISDNVLSNSIAVVFVTHILRWSNIMLGYKPTLEYSLIYVATAIISCAIVVLFKNLFRNSKFIEDDCPKKNPKGAMALKIIGLIFVTLGAAAVTATIWGKNTFGDIALDQMLITLMSPTEGTSNDVYNTALEGPVIQTFFISAFFSVLIFTNKKFVIKKGENIKFQITEYVKRILSFLLACVIFVGGLWYGIDRYHLTKLIKANYIESTYIEDNYINPGDVEIKFPEKKRNLIHIYLESVENTYFSKDLGGNMDVNLMPDLAELSKEGYSFSHNEDKFGGPTPNTGGTWSIASMINQSAGIPMKYTNVSHYHTPDDFLPTTVALGDILAEQGYEQTLMIGAEANFGGLNNFYIQHGNFNIWDYHYAINEGILDPDYYVWWGYEDDKLYEYAKQEITRLSQTGKPFNFVMENADTHFPDGYLSPNATEQVHESQYGNVIYFSQGEVAKFVKWIQEQPFYENTTVILIGDHLSMDANFFDKYVDRGFERSTYNLILNPDPSIGTIGNDRLYNRRWANFDMFPTILTSLGVDYGGNRLGMGTNLFSNEPTLFERDGVHHVNSEIEKFSAFYNGELLLEDVESKKK